MAVSNGRWMVGRPKKPKPCKDCGGPRSKPQYTRCATCEVARRRERYTGKRQRHCKGCGKPFISQRGNKCCSTECRSLWRPMFLPVICGYCSTPFRKTAAAVKRTKGGVHYCSKDHQHLGLRGAGSVMFRGPQSGFRGKEWRKLSEQIRARDGWRCQRCGKTEMENGAKLSVDHIRPWRSFEDKAAANDPENLVSLCKKCHSWKTARAERLWLAGDVQAFEQYVRSITLGRRECHMCDKVIDVGRPADGRPA